MAPVSDLTFDSWQTGQTRCAEFFQALPVPRSEVTFRPARAQNAGKGESLSPGAHLCNREPRRQEGHRVTRQSPETGRGRDLAGGLSGFLQPEQTSPVAAERKVS